MLKKTIIVVCVVVLVVCMTVMPVSAATINYWDYITSTDVSAGDDVCTLEIPVSLWRMSVYDSLASKSIRVVNNTDLINVFFSELQKTSTGDVSFYEVFRPFSDDAFRVDNIPNGSTFDFALNLSLKASHTMELVNAVPHLTVRFYDKNGASVDGRQYVYSDDALYIENGKNCTGKITYSFDLAKPDTAVYCSFYFYLTFTPVYPVVEYGYIQTIINSFSMKVSIDSLYRNSQAQSQTNEKLDDINDKLENLPDDIGDQMEQVAENEKQQASTEGNSNVGAVTDAVPDYSEGFVNAISSFAKTMSYEGTDATLTIPALTIPAIGDIIPETALSEEMVLDFGQYIKLLPDGILLLVQSLLTIALIVYCFKELYDTIAYVVTLRKGADE